MKRLANLITAIVLCVAFASCDGHMPRGILVEKEYRASHTTMQYSPTTHTMRPMHHPRQWVFVVQCDSCGHRHTCNVDEETFSRFNIGDSVTAKGYYHGKEKE